MRRHKPAMNGQQEQRDVESVNIPRQVRILDWMQTLLTGSRRCRLVKTSLWMLRLDRHTVGL